MTKSPHLTLMTSPAVVVKMSVTVIENSPSQAILTMMITLYNELTVLGANHLLFCGVFFKVFSTATLAFGRMQPSKWKYFVVCCVSWVININETS